VFQPITKISTSCKPFSWQPEGVRYARDPMEFFMRFTHIQEMLANSSADGTMHKTVADSSANGTVCKYSGSQYCPWILMNWSTFILLICWYCISYIYVTRQSSRTQAIRTDTRETRRKILQSNLHRCNMLFTSY
jgi:hypothetical protein